MSNSLRQANICFSMTTFLREVYETKGNGDCVLGGRQPTLHVVSNTSSITSQINKPHWDCVPNCALFHLYSALLLTRALLTRLPFATQSGNVLQCVWLSQPVTALLKGNTSGLGPAAWLFLMNGCWHSCSMWLLYCTGEWVRFDCSSWWTGSLSRKTQDWEESC